jgi:L-cysteine S-thiosulfotransferase
MVTGPVQKPGQPPGRLEKNMNNKLSVFLLAVSLLIAPLATLASPATSAGEQLAFNKKKGNCLACHAMPSDPRAVTSANIGPPLVNMKQRYPDKAKLRAQIWDATRRNPDTVMPPYGRNKILTEHEIDLVTDFIQSL